MTNLAMSIERRPAPVKAAAVIKPGQLLSLELASGMAVPYTTAPGHIFLGYATHSADATGLNDGDVIVLYSAGMVDITPAAGVTPYPRQACYGVDPDTFNVTPGTGRFVGLAVQKRVLHDGTLKWTVDTTAAFHQVPEPTV